MRPSTSIGLVKRKTETVLSVRINMHLKRNVTVTQVFSKDEGVLYVNGRVVRGVPKEHFGRIFSDKWS